MGGGRRGVQIEPTVRGYLWSGYHPEMCIQEVLVGALQAVYQVAKKDLEQHRTLCSVSIFVVRCFAAAGTRLALNQRDTRSFACLSSSLAMVVPLRSVSLAYVRLYLRVIRGPKPTQGAVGQKVLGLIRSANSQGRMRGCCVSEHLLTGVQGGAPLSARRIFRWKFQFA